MLQVITAKDYDQEMQTPESIEKFTRKHNIDQYPVLTIRDWSGDFASSLAPHLDYGTYDRDGKFIETQTFMENGCLAPNSFSLIMSYVLEGDTTFYKDSLSYTVYRTSVEGVRDTIHETIPAEADFSSMFATLDGKLISLDTLFTDYVVLFNFSLSGKAKYSAILIRELADEIDALNAKYEEQISLLLVCEDQFKWMKDGESLD